MTSSQARYVVHGASGPFSRTGVNAFGRPVMIDTRLPVESQDLARLRELVAPLIGFEHPRLVPLIELIELRNDVAAVWGLVPWEPISLKLKDQAHLPPAAALHIAADALEGLSVIRLRGVEPDVCLLETVLVAKELEPTGALGQARACISDTIRSALAEFWEPTEPVQLIANFDYFAPELLRGGFGSPASDVYAAGALLRQMLIGDTGQHDFRMWPAVVRAYGLGELRTLYATPASPPAMDSELAALLASLRDVDPRVRPSPAAMVSQLRAMAEARRGVPPISAARE